MMAEMPGFIQLQAGADSTRALGLDQEATWQQARRRRPAHACRSATGGTHGRRGAARRLRLGRAAAGRARPGAWRCATARRAGRDDLPALRATSCCSWSATPASRPPAIDMDRPRAWSTWTPPTAATAACRWRQRAAAGRAHLEAGLRARQPARRQGAPSPPSSSCWPAATPQRLPTLAAAGGRARRRRRPRRAPRWCAAGRRAGSCRRCRRRPRGRVFDADARPRRCRARAPRGAALRVTVLNGNLSFVRQPLLVGHYRSAALTGTEPSSTGWSAAPCRRSLDAGLYPDALGTHQIFVNTCAQPRQPAGALPRPAGGGGGRAWATKGTLRDMRAARQRAPGRARLGAARRRSSPAAGRRRVRDSRPRCWAAAASASRPAAPRAPIAQGVREANDRLAGSGWPLVSRLTLVELYLDRASEAWRALQVLATASPDRFELRADHRQRHRAAAPQARQRLPRRRLRLHHRHRRRARPDSIDLHARHAARAHRDAGADRRRASCCATWWRAPRTTPTTRPADRPHPVPAAGAGGDRALPGRHAAHAAGAGRPHRAAFPGSCWTRPTTAAAAPTRGPGPSAASCCASCARRTSAPQPRDAGADDARARDRRAAVDPAQYAPLPGALAEARAVVAQLSGARRAAGRPRARCVGGDDAPAASSTRCWRGRYRIVHVAGHGEAGDARRRRAVGRHLPGRRARSQTMRTRARAGVRQLLPPRRRATPRRRWRARLDRSAFAAGVADKLIEIGVRCVIAAGWAVEDGPAETFATTFYRELLAGARFIDAVGAAREAAWADDPGGNTWAAYQCYGDPGWTFAPPAAATRSGAAPGRRRIRRHRVGRWRWRWRSKTLAVRDALRARAGAGSCSCEQAAPPARRASARCGAAWARWPRPSAWPTPKPGTSTPRSPGTSARCTPATAARRCSRATSWKTCAPARPGRPWPAWRPPPRP